MNFGSFYVEKMVTLTLKASIKVNQHKRMPPFVHKKCLTLTLNSGKSVDPTDCVLPRLSNFKISPISQ